MKYVLIAVIGILLASCGTRVPYTNDIREEFGLDTEQAIRKVQFITSATIIFEKNKISGGQGTNQDGTLVTSSNKTQDRVIIPSGTKCVFDSYGDNGALNVRFEVGVGKTIKFAVRDNSQNGKYYLVADWNNGAARGTVSYGNELYTATSASAVAYLQVIRKKLQKTKRKDRVVKGMKV